MKTISLGILALCILFFNSTSVYANYDRNKAVPVEKVLFGSVVSVRNISHEELIRDKKNGWHTFGGALIGGVIGNQFGGGSGRDVATILGAIIGGSIANNRHSQPEKLITYLVELMIKTDSGEQFMVIQDYDNSMVFHSKDKVRMIYLANSTVRIDKQR
ncbi:glycine zipper 2TM domain-containing protein [Candidatus Colwellia aromaticivorans]|uniref:glycine zipper 2TM domain-containing protein n=1 Tax=Candidatus Colwellia aromaticivorans TaxID=2267621 RepID=UPI000DF3E6B1|nr:glycine zipper 2TM domain-containing protein [Candidatus Colwellia aromaticivorans]